MQWFGRLSEVRKWRCGGYDVSEGWELGTMSEVWTYIRIYCGNVKE